MSYTPPAGNAANFSWSGQGAYTPPAGNAANFSWLPPDVISLKCWSGSTWIEGRLKRYSGTAWEFLPTANLQTYCGLAWATPITT